MGEAFISRRGGGYTRLEIMPSISHGSDHSVEWKNLNFATDIYFLRVLDRWWDDETVHGELEAFIENGEIEVLGGSLTGLSIGMSETSIRIGTSYSNTYVSDAVLYRFC